MKRFSLFLLAASSLLWPTARAETRPRYGGTLRVQLRGAPQALEPGTLTGGPLSNISRHIFETLVALDGRGRPQPLLAASWQSEPGNQRWRFLLRSGVSFHDGTALNAAAVVASLRSNNPEWRIVAAGNSITIETDAPDPDLPSELAMARNGIVHRNGSELNGTGPFISKSELGKHLTLIANDQYWGGRPFVDSVEVDFGVSDRDSAIALDLGKADVVEVAPENIQRTRSQGRIVAASEPDVLLALSFANEALSEIDAQVRTALAQSIDTAAINNVVLQGGSEPTGALLPNWLSGYGFVFNAGTGINRSHPTDAPIPALTLAYDSADPVDRVISERILLNARDAGITLQLTTSATADLRLVRVALASSDPHLALVEFAKALQLPVPKLKSDSPDEAYAAERSLLQSRRIIPLLHLRNAVALRENVRGFTMFPDGRWNLSDVWLAPERP